MSTWLYFECLDHDPPLRAGDESGQHLYDLPRIRVEIADRERLVDEYISGPVPDWDADTDVYFRRHSAAFLAAHPHCRIGIRDEYGLEHPTTEEDA